MPLFSLCASPATTLVSSEKKEKVMAVSEIGLVGLAVMGQVRGTLVGRAARQTHITRSTTLHRRRCQRHPCLPRVP